MGCRYATPHFSNSLPTNSTIGASKSTIRTVITPTSPPVRNPSIVAIRSIERRTGLKQFRPVFLPYFFGDGKRYGIIRCHAVPAVHIAGCSNHKKQKRRDQNANAGCKWKMCRHMAYVCPDPSEEISRVAHHNHISDRSGTDQPPIK